MSDIYVKAWIEGREDEAQETDVHYRSLDGTGNFNWRMIFPVDYLDVETCHVVKKKSILPSLGGGGVVEEKRKPTIVFQVWDNDMFSADDFLGEFRLDLTATPVPAKTAEKCQLDILPEIRRKLEERARKKEKEEMESQSKKLDEEKSFVRKCFPFVCDRSGYSLLSDDALSAGKSAQSSNCVNLFEQKRIKGFFPFVAADEASSADGGPELAGKLEVELEVVTSFESESHPAGKGREEPNANPTLDPPQRPETSFLWIASPWKSLKHVIWKKFRKFIVKFLVIALITVFILLLLYSLPETINKKIWGVL